MTLERRLREHFDAAQVLQPPAALAAVVHRGRRRRTIQNSAMAAGTLGIMVVGVLVVQGITRSNVEFAPAAPPVVAARSAAPVPGATESSSPAATEQPSAGPQPTAPTAAPAVESIDPRELGATVVAHSRNDDAVLLVDDAGADASWQGRAVTVLPDGDGGFVVQNRAGHVVWVPRDGRGAVSLNHVADPNGSRKTAVTLRAVDDRGMVTFSTRPAKRYDEGIVERFFAVHLDGGAEPVLLAEQGAYEAWSVGPARVPNGHVMASCHLLCDLYRWPDDDDVFPFPDPVYSGEGRHGSDAAIEGLASAPNRTLVAFVESNEMLNDVPELVVLDAATFKQRLRLSLPVRRGTRIGGAVVSLSADGQRILVALDAAAIDDLSVPRTTFLVDDALTDDPSIRRVDFPGVVQWLDPASVHRE